MRWWALVLGLFLAGAAHAAEPEFSLPISCKLGETCWVQNYFDHDPTTGTKDYACGHETYDGHDGTDIRVRDIGQTAEVIASAPGTVTATRDGVADHLVMSEADRAAIKNIECGNGAVVDHGDGWQTQYCHMRSGSVVVRKGDKVERGAKLGEVGYSGMAAFPHVHLTVRKNGKSLDPFNSHDIGCGAMREPLWSQDAKAALSYQKGAVIAWGFLPGPVQLSDLEKSGILPKAPEPSWPAVVAYAWAINLKAGDSVTVKLDGPAGISAINSTMLDRDKAQFMLFAGKKSPAGLPTGDYRASITVSSGGEVRLTQEWNAAIP